MKRPGSAWTRTWKRRSLRFWFLAGMWLSLAPLVASAIVGYGLLDSKVIHPFDTVVTTQHAVLEPVQDLRLLLWQAAMPVNDYLIHGGSDETVLYEELRLDVDAAFGRLEVIVSGDERHVSLLAQGHRNWMAATRVASEILALSEPRTAVTAAPMMEEFDALVALAAQDLSALYERLRGDLMARRDMALAAHSTSKYMAAMAFALSVLFVFLGMLLISRMLVRNIEKLAEASRRFASGDRTTSLDIAAPPELRKVGKAFNDMVSRIVAQEKAMVHSANTDALTGLLNRRGFDQALSEELSRSRRYGTPVALMLLDIDHFKKLNDTHGHLAGDRALARIARIVEDNARETDMACRYGGEEFAVILPSTDAASAEVLGERLRSRIEATEFDIGGGRMLSLTVSIGIAMANDATDNPAALIQAADEVLYKSKKRGRNKLTIASSGGGSTPKPHLRIIS